jgi:hypothetical protein
VRAIVAARREATAASTGPAAARDEGAASAVGDRHVGDTDNALGRDHASGAISGAGRKRQARDAAANAGCKACHTNNAFSRDHAGHAIACKQARNANASARWKTSDTVIGADACQAGHGLDFAATCQRCKACNAATSSRRKFSATACKVSCASGCRCEPGTTSAGAQACSTAAKGMPAREEDGCDQWPASL